MSRRRRRRRRGGKFNFRKIGRIAKNALKFAKDHKLVSKGAKLFGYDNVGDAAEKLGFGRRRRRRGYGRRAFNGGSSQPALLNAYLRTKI